MAQAVENKAEFKTEPQKRRIWSWTFSLASLAGALYVWLGVILVHHLGPELWNAYIGQLFEGNMILGGTLKFTVLAGLIATLVYAWPRLFPRMDGLAGGVFLMALGWLAAATVWWLGGRFLEWIFAWWRLGETANLVGLGLLTLFALAEIFWLYRWASSARFRNWSLTLQDQGWFSLVMYKKEHGIWLRRGTMIAVILLLAAGIWHYTHFRLGGSGEWVVRMPLSMAAVCIVRMPRLTLSLAVLAAGSWFAWRLVNLSRFADFLISAENEMVKVYWPTWRSLWRDTIVVLVTVVLLAIFLYIMDILWTIILGQFLGVLGG